LAAYYQIILHKQILSFSMYYSFTQMANLLGITRQALQKRSDIATLKSSGDYQIKGRGGAKHFPIYLLPEDIQQAIWDSEPKPTISIAISDVETVKPAVPRSVPPQPDPVPAAEEVAPSLPAALDTPLPTNPHKIAQMEAWQAIFVVQKDWSQGKSFATQLECDREFVEIAPKLIDPCHLSAIQWGTRQRGGLSVTTLQRRRRAVAKSGLHGLIRSDNRSLLSKSSDHPAAIKWIVGFAVQHPRTPIARLYKEFRKWWGAKPQCPALTTIRRWLNNWIADNRAIYTALTNPEKWRSAYKATFGTHDDTTAPNQIWEMDSTKLDVMFGDGRSYFLALIDVHTRRVMSLVSKTSKAEAVMTLLRQAIVEWGVPDAIRTDNGSDYISQAVIRFCAQAEIERKVCTPGTPTAKPYIERWFRSFNHDKLSMLKGYVGHNVPAAQQLRALNNGKQSHCSMSESEFQSWANEWIAEYHDRTHQGLGASPKSAYQASLDGGWQPRRVVSVRQLDMLLASIGQRQICSQGIRVANFWYIAEDLRVGDRVWVSVDPREMGTIYIFDIDNNYLGEAKCPELANIDRREIAEAAKRSQIAEIAEAKRRLKSAKKLEPHQQKALSSVLSPPAPKPLVSSSLDTVVSSPLTVDSMLPELARRWLSGLLTIDPEAPRLLIKTAIRWAKDASQHAMIQAQIMGVIRDKKVSHKFIQWLASDPDAFLHSQAN
jgi:transposase InsO family protein